jgi:hydrogenase maturation protease
MTTATAAASTARIIDRAPRRSTESTGGRPTIPDWVTVRLLVCGNADRGDDGAGLTAAAHVLPRLDEAVRRRIEVRRCVQLDVTDVVDVGAGQSCVIVDTVVGIVPGEAIVVPLADLTAWPRSMAPRSSHALPIDQVVGIAAAVRGEVPRGLLVGIGGAQFEFRRRRSRALTKGMPAFEAALEAALLGLAEP